MPKADGIYFEREKVKARIIKLLLENDTFSQEMITNETGKKKAYISVQIRELNEEGITIERIWEGRNICRLKRSTDVFFKVYSSSYPIGKSILESGYYKDVVPELIAEFGEKINTCGIPKPESFDSRVIENGFSELKSCHLIASLFIPDDEFKKIYNRNKKKVEKANGGYEEVLEIARKKGHGDEELKDAKIDFKIIQPGIFIEEYSPYNTVWMRFIHEMAQLDEAMQTFDLRKSID